MKFSKLFPMGTDEADDYIERIVVKGSLKQILHLKFPYLKEAHLLYRSPFGLVTIEKKPKEGKWEVTIET